jgi:hypothetical protein
MVAERTPILDSIVRFVSEARTRAYPPGVIEGRAEVPSRLDRCRSWRGQ